MTLIALMSLVVTGACAQKVQINVDKITGDSIVHTSPQKIYSKPTFTGTVGEQLRVSAAKSKMGFSLVFAIQTGKTSLFSIDENSKCSIKLESGKVIELRAATDIMSKYTGTYGARGSAMFFVDAETIEELTAENVSVIRIQTSRGNFDYDISGKKNVAVISEHLKKIKG